MPNHIEVEDTFDTSFGDDQRHLITLKNESFNILRERNVNYLEGCISILGTPAKEVAQRSDTRGAT